MDKWIKCGEGLRRQVPGHPHQGGPDLDSIFFNNTKRGQTETVLLKDIKEESRLKILYLSRAYKYTVKCTSDSVT